MLSSPSIHKRLRILGWVGVILAGLIFAGSQVSKSLIFGKPIAESNLEYQRSMAQMPSAVGKNVEVREIRSCGKSNDDIRGGDSIDEVETNGTRTVIRVGSVTACGGTYAVSPKVWMHGDRTEIRWSWWKPARGPQTACKCRRQLEFTLIGPPAEKRVFSIGIDELSHDEVGIEQTN
jgi:hypothetical protein